MATTLSTPFRYQITIRNVVYGADSFKLLSEIYCLVRDASGEGCSTFLPASIRENGKEIGYLSYNGRIWNGRLWNGLCDFTDTATILYDNRRTA